MTSATFFQIQSFLILALIYIGVYHRKNRKLHVKIMPIAMIWDVLLILQIELTRSAIATAIKPQINHMMLNIHISLAVSTVICYIFMAKTGRQLYINNFAPLKKHRILGWTTLILRTLTLITSFYTVIK